MPQLCYNTHIKRKKYNESVIYMTVSAYERIYNDTIDNYGIITVSRAKALGISTMTLVMLEKRGRLSRLAHGVYRIDKYVPTEYDVYACSVAKVDENAYVWGPSVLAMKKLCATDPGVVYVASNRRIRKKLPSNIKVVVGDVSDRIELIEGIRAQSVEQAIEASRGFIMSERLEEARNAATKR